jgi:hypothetical protein
VNRQIEAIKGNRWEIASQIPHRSNKDKSDVCVWERQEELLGLLCYVKAASNVAYWSAGGVAEVGEGGPGGVSSWLGLPSLLLSATRL